MKLFIYLVITLVVGFLLGRKSVRIPLSSKQMHLKQILDYLESNDQVTNNDVEQMLSVSDATAERYLDELEKQRKLKQVGKTGRNVIYRKL